MDVIQLLMLTLVSTYVHADNPCSRAPGIPGAQQEFQLGPEPPTGAMEPESTTRNINNPTTPYNIASTETSQELTSDALLLGNTLGITEAMEPENTTGNTINNTATPYNIASTETSQELTSDALLLGNTLGITEATEPENTTGNTINNITTPYNIASTETSQELTSDALLLGNTLGITEAMEPENTTGNTINNITTSYNIANGMTSSLAVTSDAFLSVTTPDTTVTDNVTYTCMPGMLFSDGTRIKKFMCKNVNDWREISELSCTGKMMTHSYITDLLYLKDRHFLILRT